MEVRLLLWTSGLRILLPCLAILAGAGAGGGQELRPDEMEALRARALAPAEVGSGGWNYASGEAPLSVPVLHLALDAAGPFHVYAGLGRGGSWRVPSDVPGSEPIRDEDWVEIGAGDGFAVLPDPTDARHVYASGMGGDLIRFDLATGERRSIRPWAPDTVDLRFGPDAPLAVDPFLPGVLYYGSQFVHRTSDQGRSWQIVSGDLTKGVRPAARGEEGTPAILALAPSPVERELIWAGTGDGRLYLTRSGGGAWEEIPSRIRGLPDHWAVSHIEPSRRGSGRAYVSFQDLDGQEDEPLLYRTERYGRDWTRLDGLPGPVHALLEDPVSPELLFAGTEAGLYLSLNGGADWLPFTHGVPALPVRSLALHPRDHDLVVGTGGGGIYVLDDIRPLRVLAQEPGLMLSALTLFPPPAAHLEPSGVRRGRADPATGRIGEGRDAGALLTFWVGENAPLSPAVLEIRDVYGELVRTIPLSPRAGMNRVTWDLKEDAREPREGEGAGLLPPLEVLPEGHALTVRVGEASSTQSLEVLADPRESLTLAQRIAKKQATRTAGALVVFLELVERRVEEIRRGLERVQGVLEPGEAGLGPQVSEVRSGLEDVLTRVAGLDGDRRVLGSMGTTRDPPTESERIALYRVEEGAGRVATALNTVLLGPLTELRRGLGPERADLLPEPSVVIRPSWEREGDPTV